MLNQNLLHIYLKFQHMCIDYINNRFNIYILHNYSAASFFPKIYNQNNVVKILYEASENRRVVCDWYKWNGTRVSFAFPQNSNGLLCTSLHHNDEMVLHKYLLSVKPCRFW